MFGGARRHRPQQRPTSSSSNPSAASAAASAFMISSGQNPNKALSSAAAAAALKARPQSPTNVGDVQTKRTIKRTASVSSNGSARPGTAGRSSGAPAGPPALQRRGSSGSMSERTFRSPSPHGQRPGSRSGDQPGPEHEPPVPQIPASHRKAASSSALPATSGPRAAAGMQSFRTASQKNPSELPSWYTQPHGNNSNIRSSDAALTRASRSSTIRPASINTATADTHSAQRADSRASISSFNFSYPTGYKGQTPPTSPGPYSTRPGPTATTTRTAASHAAAAALADSAPHMVYDPNSRRMVAVASGSSIRGQEGPELQDKKRDAPAQGSGQQRKASVKKSQAQKAKSRQSTLPDHTEEFAAGSETKDATTAGVQLRTQPRQPIPLEDGVSSETSPEPEPARIRSPPPRISPEVFEQLEASQVAAGKQPVVAGDEEDDDALEAEAEAEATTPLSQKVLHALDAAPLRQPGYEPEFSPPETVPEETDAEPSKQQLDPMPAELSSDTPPKRPTYLEHSAVAELSTEGSSMKRSASTSPNRKTRFAAAPEGLAVRHSPLPRSASPIKSALKRTGSSAGTASPPESGLDHAAERARSPDPSAALRKKSVRVSFDERNPVILGESALPEEPDSNTLPSPQQATKRPWFNIARLKKKEVPLEDDEVMKPRPALPSFIGIRDKKARDVEERPLVRPYEPAQAPSPSASPVLRGQSPTLPDESTLSLVPETSQGQSSDLALGSIVTQDQASRNEANISRFREPLPPVVTSIEGSGYNSDTPIDSDDDQFDSFVATAETQQEQDGHAADAVPSPPTADQPQPEPSYLEDKVLVETGDQVPASEQARGDIPEIAVVRPSPMAPEPSSAKDRAESAASQYFDLPGQFPDEGSDGEQRASTSPDKGKEPASTADTLTSPSAAAVAEPVGVSYSVGQAASLPQTTLTTSYPVADIENPSASDSGSEVFSDAYEDLSDLEGDGFMSLDAVVESPVTQASPQIPELPATPVASPPSANDKEAPPPMPAPKIIDGEGDWEQAKAFWRSLTAEKRQQLEKEALDDAGADGDREDVAVPIKRSNSKRKSGDHKLLLNEKDAVQPEKLDAVRPQRAYQIQPGSKATHAPISPDRHEQSTARTSKRASAPGPKTKPQPSATNGVETGVTMRKTMRASKETQPRSHLAPAGATGRPQSSGATNSTTSRGNRTSLRNGPKQERPTSLSQHARGQHATPNGSQNVGNAAVVMAKQTMPNLHRRGSDASDSSFRRSRPGAGEGFGFRKTMRQSRAPNVSNSVPTGKTQQGNDAATKGSGRFSLRSLSPTGSPFRRNSNASSQAPPVAMMRRTLRSGSESSHDGKRLSFFSNRSSGKASTNRLGESSDEDESVAVPGASRFHSRFDDSDSDERRPSSSKQRPGSSAAASAGPPSATTGKSTPLPEEENSPDLPDSDDEAAEAEAAALRGRHHAAAAAALSQTGAPGAIGTGTLGSAGSGRLPFAAGNTTTISSKWDPASSTSKVNKRGSFMGSMLLRRNKRNDENLKIQRRSSGSDYADSAARRDTKLERNPSQLKNIRNTPGSPKLQKRSAPGMLKREGSLPLPEEEVSSPVPGSAEEQLEAGKATPLRKSGSLNTGLRQIPMPKGKRPNMVGRRSTSLGLPDIAHEHEIDAGADADDNITVISDAVPGSDPQHRKKKKFSTLRRMFRLDE